MQKSNNIIMHLKKLKKEFKMQKVGIEQTLEKKVFSLDNYPLSGEQKDEIRKEVRDEREQSFFVGMLIMGIFAFFFFFVQINMLEHQNKQVSSVESSR